MALDNSVKSRLGTVLDSVASVQKVINIDHHVSNECYGDLNYVDPSAPATGQIIYEFFKERKVPLSPEMAANLFAAISTDTGSFQYAGTDSRTFEAASALVAAGVDVAALSRKMYDSQPRRRLDLLRHALNEARFSCDGHLASFSLSLAAVDQLGVLPEDNEGVIDHLRSVEGVVAAVFFEELPDARGAGQRALQGPASGRLRNLQALWRRRTPVGRRRARSRDDCGSGSKVSGSCLS